MARFLIAIRRSLILLKFTSHLPQINDHPGLVICVNQKIQSIFSFEFSREIISIFAVVNPEKLKKI